MNCPYCDGVVHGAAKFCPKCGLPLKDDATVMGAYVGDGGDGPNWTMIGGGAAALAVIALLVGWLGSRHDNSVPPPGSLPSGWAVSQTPFSASGPYQNRSTGFATPSGRSVVDEKPRWVWNPPQQPQVGPEMTYAELPPSQYLSMNPLAMAHVPQPTYAYVAQSSGPQTPALPPEVPLFAAQTQDLSGYVLDNNEPSPPVEDPSGNYVYDPVQGRYALKAERLHGSGYSSGNTVGGTIPPRNFRQGYGNTPAESYRSSGSAAYGPFGSAPGGAYGPPVAAPAPGGSTNPAPQQSTTPGVFSPQ